MYKPYKKPVIKAFPGIIDPEPRISRFVIFLLRIFARLYLFLFYGVARSVLKGGEMHLFQAVERALSGKSRCIIAFRHPNGGEPQLLTWFFLFKLRFLAARRKIRFVRFPHTVFVYSYEVVRYGGWVPRFVMPNVGGMPVYHAKLDSKAMNRIYKSIVDGPYPVAIAPEGGVSYTTDSVPRLEAGVIRMGFNAAQQLAKKNPDCPVEILPVSFHFQFGSWGKWTLEQLIRKVEKVCGFSRKNRKLPFVQRLEVCREHILRANEERYQLKSDESLSFEKRLDLVINAALETAEQMLNVKGEGDFIPRMHRLRQICWDRIFVPELESFDKISNVKRSILDLRAGEAWHIGRHIELLTFCWYFRIPVAAEDALLYVKIEYVQNLWDFANRTMGGAFQNRVNLFPRKMIIRAAPVINLSERLSCYNSSKKDAIAAAMSDLENAYLKCIEDFNAGL